MRGVGLGFTNPVGTGGVSDVYMCLGIGGVCGVEVGRRLETVSGRVGWCYVGVSLDSLSRWQFQVYVYCDRRIPAHYKCTQC